MLADVHGDVRGEPLRGLDCALDGKPGEPRVQDQPPQAALLGLREAGVRADELPEVKRSLLLSCTYRPKACPFSSGAVREL